MCDCSKVAHWTHWLLTDDTTLRAELASIVAACDTLEQAAAVLNVPVEWLREAVR